MRGWGRELAMLIDCHAHLDSYSDAEVGDILERGRRVGVGFVKGLASLDSFVGLGGGLEGR